MSELPRIIRPLPGATHEIAKAGSGTFGVEYHLDAEFPATGELSEILAQIPTEWTPRTEDLLNPGIPTSHVRGWTDNRDLTTTPESWVHVWQSEWQNADGELLSYSLTYRSGGPFQDSGEMGSPTNRSLHVAAGVVPREIVEEMKRFAARQR